MLLQSSYREFFCPFSSILSSSPEKANLEGFLPNFMLLTSLSYKNIEELDKVNL